MNGTVSKTMSTKVAAALMLVQQAIGGIAKDETNPHFGNDFASLGAVLDAVKPVLNAHGFVVTQFPVVPPFEDTLAIETCLIHSSGEMICGTAVVPLPKSDPQGFGSAVTYARRYALLAALGLKTVDDDGEAASGGSSLPRPAARTNSRPASPAPSAASKRPAAFGRKPAGEKPQETIESSEPVKSKVRGKAPLFPVDAAKGGKS
jgi:hypothetical protein